MKSARRRAHLQVLRIGEEVARAQSVQGFTDRQMGKSAGVAPSTVRRIRAGDGSVQVDTLCSVADAVGLDLVLKAFIGRQPSLRDSGQLAIAEVVAARARESWRPALEVAAGEHRRRVDLAFFGPEEILAMEIERLLVDFQLQFRSGLDKREVLARMHARPVRLVLVVEDTQRNRRVAREHADLIRQALPAGSREILASLRSGRPLGRDGLLWVRRRGTSQAEEQRGGGR
jgi:transcriptional regulator with XRE-family HTH domain